MTRSVGLLLHFRDDATTAQCVLSLAKEGIRDVVVVDNSEDRGASLVRLRAQLAIEAAPVMHYVEPGRNLGFGSGVNAGLALIERNLGGRHVLLINNDATLAPGTAAVLEHAVSEHSRAIAAPRIDGPTGLVDARVYYRHVSGTISVTGPGLKGHALLGGACLMLHASLCHAPLFDEAFFFYGDDIELGHRMGALGVPLLDVREGTVIHEGSASSTNGSLFYEYHMARAHLLLVSKLGYRGLARATLLATRGVTLTARASVRSLRYRSLRPFRGLLMATTDLARGRLRTLTPPAGPPHAA
jgi:GT2 family glycosyltransferase